MREFKNLKFTSLITDPDVLPTLEGDEDDRIALVAGAFVLDVPHNYVYYDKDIWGYDVDKHVWHIQPNYVDDNDDLSLRIGSYRTAEQPVDQEYVDDDELVVVGWCTEYNCIGQILLDLYDDIEEDKKNEKNN